jgi:hypothetical protein
VKTLRIRSEILNLVLNSVIQTGEDQIAATPNGGYRWKWNRGQRRAPFYGSAPPESHVLSTTATAAAAADAAADADAQSAAHRTPTTSTTTALPCTHRHAIP